MRIINGETLLQVKNLEVTYEALKNRSMNVLNKVSFELRKGETLALLGESGSGKSTIAKAITGLLPPSAHIGGTLHIGTSYIADLQSKKVEWSRIRGKQLAILFQDAQQALNPVIKIKDNFKELLLFHSIATADEVILISTKLLNMLHFPDAQKILDSYPFQLSGGMCQRVCLALVLSLKPLVLIADEPTSALDTVSQKEVLDLLVKLQKELNLTVLLITHDIAVANAISDRVMVLNGGIIEEEGNTQDVLGNPRAGYTRHLLSARAHISKPNLKPELNLKSQPLLEIIQLEKVFGLKKQVLHDVNLTLNQGGILGILGESGCGKSTLAKCITGLVPPNRGRILYRGMDITQLRGTPKRELCKHIQLIFQDARASLNPRRTALQLVQEPLQYLNIGQRKKREAMAGFYLDQVEIREEAQMRRPPQLSTGQCQRIAIARALVLKPDILICDEAVSSLDMSIQAQILDLLHRLQQQFGFSILMISHDIKVLRSFCHHIAVMKDGTFCEVRTADELRESEQSYTQLLLKCAGDLEVGLFLKKEEKHGS